MRATLPKQLQNQEIFMLRSIPMHGIRPTHISRKLVRYSSVPESDAIQTLSHGHSRAYCQKHLGRCKRGTRLADLRRFRSSTHRQGKTPLRKRRLWRRIGLNRLCTRLNNNRSLPLLVPVSSISKNQGRDKNAYLVKYAWQYPRVYPYLRRKNARCQYPRYSDSRSWRILHNGSSLCGFRATIHTESSKVIFFTRAKRNFKFKRRYSHPIDKSTRLQCDQTIILAGFYSSKDYPEPLRRVHYYDSEIKKRFVFLTNNFDLSAITITQLYKARWHVELFFKWIKQHLRIKVFYGTSEIVVKTQIWIAVTFYVLVAILKKEYALKQSLYTILQIVSLTLLEKTSILQLFEESKYRTG